MIKHTFERELGREARIQTDHAINVSLDLRNNKNKHLVSYIEFFLLSNKSSRENQNKEDRKKIAVMQ